MHQQQPTTLGPSITTTDRPYVEDLISKVFSALPSDKGTNPSDMLDTYMLAMLGQPMNAFRSVIYKILVGSLDRALRFVPRPPELANYVRSEASYIRRINEPNALPAPPRPSVYVLAEKKWSGSRLLVENINLDQFKAMARKQDVPVGAIFVAILGNVYAGAR